MLIPRVFSPENITYADNHSAITGATFTDTTSSCDDIHNCRTLLHIIWSCISVLIASTWVSVHPNVPGPNEATGRALGRRIGLMFMTLIAPELLILWAARQWSAAKKLSKAYKRHGWTTSHAFFALMGGFALYQGKRCIAVLRFIPPPIDEEGNLEKQKIIDDFKWKEREENFRQKEEEENFRQKEEEENLKRKEGNENFYISLSTTTTSNIPKDGMDESLDDSSLDESLDKSAKLKFHDQSFAAHACFIGSMSEAQVKDRSHRDGLAKLIVVGQTTWFVIQLMARWTEKLPITQLELMTLAFAVLNVLIYFFWWYKPQGVGCHIHIQQSVVVTAPVEGVSSLQLQPLKEIIRTEVASILDLSRIIWSTPKIVLDILLDGRHVSPSSDRISFFERCSDLEHLYRERIIPSVATVLFGAIHCIAWKFIFPSASEQLFWRISSVTVTCLPLWAVFVIFVDHYVISDFFGKILLGFVAILYTVARLYLIVQAFLALRDLPLGAFKTVQWTTFIPHI